MIRRSALLVPSFAALLVLIAAAACERPGKPSAPAEGGAAESAELKEQKAKFSEYLEKLPPLQEPRKGERYELIVDYIEDPLLPSFEEKELKDLLHRIEDYAREYLKIKLKLRLREKRAIDDFFKAKRTDFEHPFLSYPARAWHIDLVDPAASEKTAAAIREAIRDRPEDLLEEYFGPIPDDREAYVKRIQARFDQRLGSIYAEKDSTGKPLFDPRANPGRREQISFAHWDSILYQEQDVDFYLTNTILAGPDTGMPLYVINRGGVTSGFVENNEHRPYKGVGMIAVYPMLSNGEFFRATRGSWTREEELDCVAFIWLHELGHLLLRKSENYTLEGSIHRAPIDLDYRAWMQAAKAKHKKLDHSGISLLAKF